MTDQRAMDRAMTLAEMAPDPSVTVGLLAGQEGAFPESRLSRPPVTYLENAEAPAFALTNAKRGIGLGTKRNTKSPSDGKGTVALVTGRRTLCLVGGPDEDEEIEIPHESVAEVTFKRGWLAHRFVLKTPRRQYHVWVSRGTEESVLSDAAEFIRDHLDETPEELAAEDGANRLTYRGQPVSPENHPGISTGHDGSGEAVSDAGSVTDSDGPDAQTRTLRYRGQEVAPENHPGIQGDDSGVTTADTETTATDGGNEKAQSANEQNGGG